MCKIIRCSLWVLLFISKVGPKETKPEVAVVKAPDCKQDKLGLKYNGTTSTTRSGEMCQPWALQFPHRHDKYKGEKKTSLIRNYCRNPDDEPEGPWCYTIDLGKRWEYCDIPICGISFESLYVHCWWRIGSRGHIVLYYVHMEALGILWHSYLRYFISVFTFSLMLVKRSPGAHGAILRPYGSAGNIVTFLSAVFCFSVYIFIDVGK